VGFEDQLMLIFIQKIILAARTIGFINAFLNFITLFNRETPQTIKGSCNTKLREKINKKVKKIDSKHNSPGSKYDVLIKDIYLHYAAWYRHKADRYWGRSSQLDRYKCAWYYVTSGELYEKAKSDNNASDQYHFAANQFRDVGAFNQSIIFYIKALILNSEEHWKKRNKARAISVSKMAGETEIAGLLERDEPKEAIKLIR
jgi:hypothetical protein